MKKLVTGGAGFIGSHIVDHLLAAGYEVRVLDNLEEPTHQGGIAAYMPTEVEFIKGDLRSKEDLKRALSGVDVIFHQAATGGFTANVGTYIDTNVLGTARMLEVIREERYPIEKVIVASSMAVYGEGRYECANHGTVYPKIRSSAQLAARRWEAECPTCRTPLRPLATDEEGLLRPERAYSISKLGEEQLVLSVTREWGIPSVALRYFLTYGPRQSVSNPYTGICSIFSTMILNDVSPIIFEDGRQTRDIIFVDDVARANLLVMKDDRANYEVFNVGTGTSISILEIFSCLCDYYKKSVRPRMSDEYRLGDVRHIRAGIDKIRRIGFEPRFTARAGLQKYVEWISSMGQVKEYFGSVEKRLRESGLIRVSHSS